MNQKIKILLVEDMPTDAELVIRELKRGKIECEVLVVDTKPKFETALKNFLPDIILSDHSLPAFDSHEALRLVKDAGITIPFILITASMSDEFAVTIMKEGAHDYIIKDRLQRLPSAVVSLLEKHRLEKEQQEAHEKLLFHIENTPLGFIEWDDQLQIRSLSGRAEEIFGWSLEEYTRENKSGFKKIYKEDFPEISKIAKQLLSGVIERNIVQTRNYTKDKRVIWCEWFNSVLKDKHGKVITIMSLVQDITESKEAAQKLNNTTDSYKQALNNLEKIMSTSLDVICTINSEGEFVDVSSASEHVWGYKPDELMGRKYMELVFEEDAEETTNAANGVVGGTPVTVFENRYVHKTGEVVPMMWSATWDENDQLMYCIAKDITDRKSAETERAKMAIDMMVRNSDLEQFAYIISHNLRAPVANIIGASNALKDEELTTQDKETLNRGINESVTRLDEVVKDLNHILQVKGEINETKELVVFSELVDDIKDSIRNLIDNIDIDISHDFSEVNELLTLKPYLYSIFYNLISNSVKYRRQQVASVISIKSRLTKTKLELIFTDNGLGIDMVKNGKHVFGLYKRFHTQIEGKGMGLFMVKTQIENLGGSISVQSAENEGTEFTIEFNI